MWAFLTPTTCPRCSPITLDCCPTGSPPRWPTGSRFQQLPLRDAAPLLAGHLTPETVGVHRLVQAVVRHALDPVHPGGAAAAVGLVLAGFPDQAEDFEAWPMTARLLPRSLAATDHAQALGVDPIATAGLLHQAGRLQLESSRVHPGQGTPPTRPFDPRGRVRPRPPRHRPQPPQPRQRPVRPRRPGRRRNSLERALSIRETRLGADHPDAAHSLTNLAAVLVDQGNPGGAIPLYERALAIRETPRWRRPPRHRPHPPQPRQRTNHPRRPRRRPHPPRTRPGHPRDHLGADHPGPPPSSTTSASSCAARATSTAPARCLNVRFRSMRRALAPTTETVTSRRNLTAVEAALDDRQ